MKDYVFNLIDRFTQGVDTYQNNGSMWLIFTDEKKWVIELTKEGTLWYNHHFFNDCFKYLSLDAVENQHYITKWVEYIIQNGVKNTGRRGLPPPPLVEDIIQNGVKNTEPDFIGQSELIEYTIQNGVIDTFKVDVDLNHLVENTIQNGVKNTSCGLYQEQIRVEDTIQNGVKEIIPGGYLGFTEIRGKVIHQFESPTQNNQVEDVIENGIKETKNGVHFFEDTTENVIKNGIKETWGYEKQPQIRVNDVIQTGKKI